MKLLLLAALIAIGSATKISVDNGVSSLYSTATGRKAVIQKQVSPSGLGGIEITVSGPSVVPKTIDVADTREGVSQEQILAQILTQFQGIVSPVQYQQLLTSVQNAVAQGEINPQFYDLLQGLIQNQYNGIWQQQGGLQSVVPPVKGIYQQYPFSGLLAQQPVQYPVGLGQQYFNYLLGRLYPYQYQQIPYGQQVPYYQGQVPQVSYYQGQVPQVSYYQGQVPQVPYYQGQVPYYQGQVPQASYYEGQQISQSPYYQAQQVSQIPYYQGQQVYPKQQFSYNQGVSGLLGYLNQQPIGYQGAQAYLPRQPIPQVVY